MKIRKLSEEIENIKDIEFQADANDPIMKEVKEQSEKKDAELERAGLEQDRTKLALNKNTHMAKGQPKPKTPEEAPVQEKIDESLNEWIEGIRCTIEKTGDGKYGLSQNGVLDDKLTISADSEEDAKQILLQYGWKEDDFKPVKTEAVESKEQKLDSDRKEIFKKWYQEYIEDLNNKKDVLMAPYSGYSYDSDHDAYYDIENGKFLSIEQVRKIIDNEFADVINEKADECLHINEDVNYSEQVAKILKGEMQPSKDFRYLSSNGTSGEVHYKGIDYAFRKLDNDTYKVMPSSQAGWNWSETLFKDESLEEDTVKTSKGKWENKGEEGTHGNFDTKKEADAQRKAMFANGYKNESDAEQSEPDDKILVEEKAEATPQDVSDYLTANYEPFKQCLLSWGIDPAYVVKILRNVYQER